MRLGRLDAHKTKSQTARKAGRQDAAPAGHRAQHRRKVVEEKPLRCPLSLGQENANSEKQQISPLVLKRRPPNR